MGDCAHSSVMPQVCDQTLGVYCLECQSVVAWCWSDEHVPEPLWNRACLNDPEAVPCDESRDDHCAICKEKIG